MGDHLEITLAVRSKVNSAFHPFVVGKMSTSITGDKLCMQRDWSGAPKKRPSGCLRLRSASCLVLYSLSALQLTKPKLIQCKKTKQKATGNKPMSSAAKMVDQSPFTFHESFYHTIFANKYSSFSKVNLEIRIHT